MSLIPTIVFCNLFSFFLACLEIEIEARHGWAEKLPTWYRTTGVAGRIYGFFMTGRPLTGYHLFLLLLLITIFHMPFAMGVPWTVVTELWMLSLFMTISSVWDYWWFVLNPYYAGKFRRQEIWWHNKSLWIFSRFPIDYLYSVGIALALNGVAAWIRDDRQPVINYAFVLGSFVVGTAVLHICAPLYHRWYWRVRQHDDRDKAGIRHP